MVDNLKIIQANLNLNNLGDTVIHACITVAFYCAAKLEEFIISNICKNFNPEKYITRQNYSTLTDQHGLPVMEFCLSITKCEPKGKDMQCAPQTSYITNPQFALDNHMHLNPAPYNTHLFACKHPSLAGHITKLLVIGHTAHLHSVQVRA